jgi:hypothetical protein
MPKTVHIKSRGGDVKECQRLLNVAGFPCGVDGYFGAVTEKVVKDFQSSVGLKSDGVVGKVTWEALSEPIEDKAVFSAPIDFQIVADLLPQMYPQKYQLKGAQCPSNPPGVSVSIGQDVTNCVFFTSWLLSLSFTGVSFTQTQWKRWMVAMGDDDQIPNWSPRVALEWEIATTSPGRGAYLVQYFTKTTGHSLIVLDQDEKSGRILTLEAVGSLDGAGWGQIGPLRDIHNPGLNWAKKCNQTWKNRIESKVAVHMSRLLIDPDSIQKWLAEG